MDVNELYRKCVEEAKVLVAREKELEARLKEVVRLKEQNAARKTRIAELEKRLLDEVGE